MEKDQSNLTPAAGTTEGQTASARLEASASSSTLAERFLEVAAERASKVKVMRYTRTPKGPRSRESVFSTTVVLRLSAEQLAFLQAIGGAQWVRAVVDEQIARLGVAEKLRDQVLAKQRRQPMHLTPRAKRPAKPIIPGVDE